RLRDRDRIDRRASKSDRTGKPLTVPQPPKLRGGDDSERNLRSRCPAGGLPSSPTKHHWSRVSIREETKMIRYRKLGYVELNVSDLEKSRKFYEEIVGLEFVGTRSDGAVMFRCDDEDSRSVILHQKQPAGFKSVGWMLEDGSQFELLHR